MTFAAIFGLTVAFAGDVRPPPEGVPAAVWALAAPAKKLTYDECSVLSGAPPACVPIEEVWTGPTREGDQHVWEVTVSEVIGDERKVREKQRVYFGASGTGLLGTGVRDRPYEAYASPQSALGPDPKPGQTWTGTYTRDRVTRTRTCEVRTSASCAGGVVSHCSAVYPDKDVVLDVHYCPGAGMVGYEGRVSAGPAALEVWSTNLRRDGSPVFLYTHK
jgi:hypothetical protein